MPLTPRQVACYVHRCDVWRVVRPVAGDGTPQADVWMRIHSSLPCHYGFTDNVDDPTGAGRAKRPTVFTVDHITLEAGIDIQDGDYFVNVTPGDPLYGQIHNSQGDAKVVMGGGRRNVNSQQIQIFVEPHPPAEIHP